MAESFSNNTEFEYKGLTLSLRRLADFCSDVLVDYSENYSDEDEDEYVRPYWEAVWLFRAYDVGDTDEEGSSLLFVCLKRRNSDVYAYGPETWDRYYVNVKDEAEGFRIVNKEWASGVCTDQSYIVVREEFRRMVDFN